MNQWGGGTALKLDNNHRFESDPTNIFNLGTRNFEISFNFYIDLPDINGAQKALFACKTDFHIGLMLYQQRVSYFLSSTGSSWNMLCGDQYPSNSVGANVVPVRKWCKVKFRRIDGKFISYLNNVKDIEIDATSFNYPVLERTEPMLINLWGSNVPYQWGPWYMSNFKVIADPVDIIDDAKLKLY